MIEFSVLALLTLMAVMVIGTCERLIRMLDAQTQQAERIADALEDISIVVCAKRERVAA